MHAPTPPFVLWADASDALLERARAGGLTCRVHPVADLQGAVGALELSRPAAVVAALEAEALDGFALLNWASANRPGLPVILVAGAADMTTTVRAIHGGAFDCVARAEIEELIDVIARALQRPADVARAPVVGAPAAGLVGASTAMARVYRAVARAARSAAPVLIRGETGTGKELVARAIHEHSPAGGRPFVALNCGALSDNLLESELFGHVKGAFTGAERDRRGLFAEAAGGTLFLDEIGEVSARLQVQLLRALQTGEYRPVGGERVQRSDARIIAATHRDLDAEVAAGRFRQDLYYRLLVIEVDVPPLRARVDDIPMLVDRFLQAADGPAVSCDESALFALQAYHWPGNVRELENAVARAAAMCRGPIIGAADLPASVRGEAPVAPGTTATLAEMELRYARRVLARCQGNKSQASRLLNVDRKTLQRILARG